jgi:hypothetical protein
MFRLFQKKQEDFVCEKCNREVTGDGYTNHCPHCLWSKHVDIFPGDRLEDCNGLMEPVLIEKEKSNFVLTHKCVVCGGIKRNKVQEEDDFDKVVELSKKISDKTL